MTHARPFWTSTFQDLFNNIKNTSMWGVLTPTIEFWIFGSLGGLPSPIFGSVSGDFTPPSKWGYDKIPLVLVITHENPFVFINFPLFPSSSYNFLLFTTQHYINPHKALNSGINSFFCNLETWLLRRCHGEKEKKKEKWSTFFCRETHCVYSVHWENGYGGCVASASRIMQLSTCEHEGEWWDSWESWSEC
jgi:hypothetical protein